MLVCCLYTTKQVSQSFDASSAQMPRLAGQGQALVSTPTGGDSGQEFLHSHYVPSRGLVTRRTVAGPLSAPDSQLSAI